MIEIPGLFTYAMTMKRVVRNESSFEAGNEPFSMSRDPGCTGADDTKEC